MVTNRCDHEPRCELVEVIKGVLVRACQAARRQ